MHQGYELAATFGEKAGNDLQEHADLAKTVPVGPRYPKVLKEKNNGFQIVVYFEGRAEGFSHFYVSMLNRIYLMIDLIANIKVFCPLSGGAPLANVGTDLKAHWDVGWPSVIFKHL